MIRSNEQGQISHTVLANINSITLETMLDVQKNMESYDIASLVFLLYDIPDLALQRLITYQRVSRDVKNEDLNLLYEWAMYYAQSKPTWRYEFLEALTICRLYNIIKKLGFNVESVKQHYDPNNINFNVYVHSVKKLLYKLCENINLETLLKLKETLMSYDIDTTEYEYCEMIFLKLMCLKFIVIHKQKEENSSIVKRTQLEKLARIIENIDSLQSYASQLRAIEAKLNNDCNFPSSNTLSVASSSKAKVDDSTSHHGNMYVEDMREVFQLFQQMNLDEVPLKNLKSDTFNLNEYLYPINNPKRVGVCCIINQENFHPSRNSIEGTNQPNRLSDRLGSRNDQLMLEKTMKHLNFVVKVECNLKYKAIFEFIKKCIKFTNEEDSIFILCILSHGVRDHIFSSDSLKVKVEDIQNMLDSDEALHLRGKPKVLIIQACRVDETPEVPRPRFVADSAATNYYLRKSHFLVYWATAPEYEAFRDEKMGSIFIQTLCYVIKKKASLEQLSDICTVVTDLVTSFCTKKQCIQVPIFESTLTRKLFLCNPNKNFSKAG